jgi:hypothetical protein
MLNRNPKRQPARSQMQVVIRLPEKTVLSPALVFDPIQNNYTRQHPFLFKYYSTHIGI